MTAPAPRSTLRRDLLHLAVLSAFAVAQPVFDLLGRFATFFVAHGAQPRGIIAFTLALCLIPPCLLAAIELLAGLVGARARQAVHLTLVALLVAAIVLAPLHRAVAMPAALSLALAAAAGALAAGAYARVGAVRMFVTALAPAVAIFPLLFLFGSSVAPLVRSDAATVSASIAVARPSPVVFVVFDELSLFALLDGRREIDAVRYPNFAALARLSTWYRNATSVADFTPAAVPAILTGRLPDYMRVPTWRDHPRNLFTLLGGTYAIRQSESMTDLCPPPLCAPPATAAGEAAPIGPLLGDAGLLYLHMIAPPTWRAGLPDIQHQWTFQFRNENLRRVFRTTSEDRVARFDRFLATLEPGDRPVLYFLHLLLPHSPYQYLPSGTRYEPPPPSFGRPPLDLTSLVALDRIDIVSWAADNPEGARAEQLRSLNQLGFVDTLIGRLLARLRATGLLDEALLVVTADHGVCFRPGLPSRLAVAENLPDLMSVPLFIKLPGQADGRVDERNAETIDVLPTVADVLGIDVPWPLDGQSLQGPATPRTQKVMLTPTSLSNQLDLKRFTVDAPLPEWPAVLTQRQALFGTGSALDAGAPSPLLRRLLGEPVEALRRPAPAAFSAVLEKPERYAKVDPTSRIVPAFVWGHVEGAAPPHTPLAIAVNGVVRAVTEVLPDGASTPAFGALVPEAAWRPGANRVEVFAVIADGDALGLAPLAAKR